MEKKLSNEEYFNRFAEKGYDQLMAADGYSVPHAVFEGTRHHLAGGQGPLRILDVGIGTGQLSALFREGFGKKANIVGVDISQKMLDDAAKNNVADRLVRLDISKDLLPFDDDRFDASVSSAVFEFLPDVKNAFNEMARVTKPGGLVVIACEAQGSPYPAGCSAPAEDKDQARLSSDWPMPTDWFQEKSCLTTYRHSSKRIKEQMEEAGLELIFQEPFIGYEDKGAHKNYVYRLYVGKKPAVVFSPL